MISIVFSLKKKAIGRKSKSNTAIQEWVKIERHQ